MTNLPYSSKLQPWGSYFGLVFFQFPVLLNGLDVFFPENWSTSSFFTAYVGIPLSLAFCVGDRIYTWRDPWLYDLASMDLSVDEVEGIIEEVPRTVDGKRKRWHFVTLLWE
jgi:amino acid transporter